MALLFKLYYMYSKMWNLVDIEQGKEFSLLFPHTCVCVCKCVFVKLNVPANVPQLRDDDLALYYEMGVVVRSQVRNIFEEYVTSIFTLFREELG